MRLCAAGCAGWMSCSKGYEKAAGQRNILVHMYVEVDPELIYKTLQEDLDAFNEFAECVLRVLED